MYMVCKTQTIHQWGYELFQFIQLEIISANAKQFLIENECKV